MFDAGIFDDNGFVSVADRSEYDDKVVGKRLKTPKRSIDWAAIVHQIMVDTGANIEEIASATGISVSTLYKIKNENESFTTGDKVINLLGVFTMNTKRDVPLLGDYHDLGNGKQ